MFQREPGPNDIRPEDAFKVFDRLLVNRAEDALGSGVGHGNVQSSESPDSLRDSPDRSGLISGIGHDLGARSLAPEAFAGRGQLLRRTAHQHDARAFVHESFGDRFADSTGRTRDKDHFPFKSGHFLFSLESEFEGRNHNRAESSG